MKTKTYACMHVCVYVDKYAGIYVYISHVYMCMYIYR